MTEERLCDQLIFIGFFRVESLGLVDSLDEYIRLLELFSHHDRNEWTYVEGLWIEMTNKSF
jgi:hypothetical protein